MLYLRWIRIRRYERGLVFRHGDFVRLLEPGRHWVVGVFGTVRVDRVSTREVSLQHADLELLVRKEALDADTEVLDLADHQRALVWVDGRFSHLCGSGLHVLWTAFHKVRAEVIDATVPRFVHPALRAVLETDYAAAHLETVEVAAENVGLLYVDGCYQGELEPGTHAFWRGRGRVRVVEIDRREQVLDIAGQEVMTADKVTLRLNAVVTYKVADPRRAVSTVGEHLQALYREAQLVLRAVIGARELDQLLADKDGAAAELDERLRQRVAGFGIEVLALGLRDVVLPGEMRTLMNRVTEARKAAEANLVARREETAAMRSQANTARIFASNPTLLKLRELEVLEKVADQANLTVMLSETGLSERITKMI